MWLWWCDGVIYDDGDGDGGDDDVGGDGGDGGVGDRGDGSDGDGGDGVGISCERVRLMKTFLSNEWVWGLQLYTANRNFHFSLWPEPSHCNWGKERELNMLPLLPHLNIIVFPLCVGLVNLANIIPVIPALIIVLS